MCDRWCSLTRYRLVGNKKVERATSPPAHFVLSAASSGSSNSDSLVRPKARGCFEQNKSIPRHPFVGKDLLSTTGAGHLIENHRNLSKIFSHRINMIRLGQTVFAQMRRTMGQTLPPIGDDLPVIRFPAAFNNLKKVKKNLQYQNSLYVTQRIRSSASKVKQAKQ